MTRFAGNFDPRGKITEIAERPEADLGSTKTSLFRDADKIQVHRTGRSMPFPRPSSVKLDTKFGYTNWRH
jgi:hypothetical protein